MNHLFKCMGLTAVLLTSLLSVHAAEPGSAAAKQDAATLPARDTVVPETIPVIQPVLLPRVRIQTSQGDMILELYNEKAPISVANFLGYVNEGNYDSTLFHRVINNFMIQGGAYSADYKPRYTHAAIISEANNGLKNERGTIAMARAKDPNTATNTFFINSGDNKLLNFHSPTPGHWGFTVFGKVVEGLDVLDKIQHLPTGAIGPFAGDAPLTPVVITRINIEPSAPQVLLANVVPLPVVVPDNKVVKEKAKKSASKSTKAKTAKAKKPPTQAKAKPTKEVKAKPAKKLASAAEGKSNP